MSGTKSRLVGAIAATGTATLKHKNAHFAAFVPKKLSQGLGGVKKANGNMCTLPRPASCVVSPTDNDIGDCLQQKRAQSTTV